MLRNLDLAFRSCDLVVVSDYAYGVVSEALIERLRTLCAERPCVLVIDSKDLRRVRQAQATVVTPNHREALMVVAPSARSHGEVHLGEMEQVGTKLLALIDAEWAAITLGAHGVLLVDRNDTTLHIPARPVVHANDVGAGDSFTAALALALGAGADRECAARIAIEAAAIAVTKERTAIVTQQELLQRVSLGYAVVTKAHAHFAEVCAQVQAARNGADGHPRTIVFTNGVFDLLHAGHVHFLRAAKTLGDVLVVGINSDRSARRLKGKHRPINTEQDRMALVSALESVDYVVLFDKDTPIESIRSLRPDVHVNSICAWQRR